MDFNQIVLTREQQELLRWIAVWWEKLPSGKRNFTAAVNPASGDFIDVGGHDRLTIQYSALEELRDKGLVGYTERAQMGTTNRPVAERVAIRAEGLQYLAWLQEAGRGELSIRLTDEQTDLLILLVEETRRISGGQQYEFFTYGSMGGDFIMVERKRIPTFLPDVRELDRKGLISLRETNSGAAFVVSPEGFEFYEEVKRARGGPVERVEAEVRHLLDRELLENFGEAIQRWREAEDLLWRVDAQDQLTAIGHKAREALQSFAQALYERHCPEADPLPNEQTVDKIRSVLSPRRSVVGKTTEDFLIAYWGTVSDLAVRAEHDSQRENRRLLWGDGRRLVFQTLLVMAELAAAVGD